MQQAGFCCLACSSSVLGASPLGCCAYAALAFLQGDKVKRGQAVAYIEQLGTFVPVEVGPYVVNTPFCFCVCLAEADSISDPTVHNPAQWSLFPPSCMCMPWWLSC